MTETALRPPTRCWRASRRRSARGCASTSARRRASARPTRCSRTRTRCSARGLDVVIGFVETYGRADTEAQCRRPRERAAAPDRVPRRHARRRWTWTPIMQRQSAGRASSTSWRTPTCRAATHEKRYEDVLELLDAGIHVMTAVNIQHLETLNDAVAQVDRRARARNGARLRSSSAPTRSSTSTSTVEELRNRLRAGKDLRARKGRAGAHQLLPQGQSLDAARAGAARGGGRGRREGRKLPRAGRARAGAVFPRG